MIMASKPPVLLRPMMGGGLKGRIRPLVSAMPMPYILPMVSCTLMPIFSRSAQSLRVTNMTPELVFSAPFIRSKPATESRLSTSGSS